MATRYGFAILEWLIERGWQKVPVDDPEVIGDQWVCDCCTQKEMTVYEAAKIQQERTGEYPDFLTYERDNKESA